MISPETRNAVEMIWTSLDVQTALDVARRDDLDAKTVTVMQENLREAISQLAPALALRLKAARTEVAIGERGKVER